MAQNYDNILVINLMHIGDLMLVTPVLRTLRSAYPRARLTLLADQKLRDLVEHNQHLTECLLIDKKGADDKLPAFVKFIGKIRAKKYDLAINLHRNERASALAAFSGAKKIIGYSKPGFAWFFDAVYPNKKPVMHQIHSHFEVLTRSGVVAPDEIDDGGLEMWLPPGAAESAAAKWRAAYPDPARRIVAFNIGASWPTKRWLPDYFAVVADTLLAEGYGVAFFGGPTDNEMVDECLSYMKNADNPLVRRFTGQVGLGELAALLKKCVLFITTDSGPMHVGVAMHVPVVTMFGSSPVPGFYPYDAKDVLIKTPEKCHPCGIHICPKQGAENFACMKNIPPDVVLQYAHELLAKYQSMVGDVPYPYGEYKCRVIEL